MKSTFSNCLREEDFFFFSLSHYFDRLNRYSNPFSFVALLKTQYKLITRVAANFPLIFSQSPTDLTLFCTYAESIKKLFRSSVNIFYFLLIAGTLRLRLAATASTMSVSVSDSHPVLVDVGQDVLTLPW